VNNPWDWDTPATEPPTVNVPLLRKAVEWVEAQPCTPPSPTRSSRSTSTTA